MTTPQLWVTVGGIIVLGILISLTIIQNKRLGKVGAEKIERLCQNFKATGIDAKPLELEIARMTDGFLRRLLENYQGIKAICALHDEEFDYACFWVIEGARPSALFFQYLTVAANRFTEHNGIDAASTAKNLADSFKAPFGLSVSRRSVWLSVKRTIPLFGSVRNFKWKGEERLVRILNADEHLNDMIITQLSKDEHLAVLTVYASPSTGCLMVGTGIFMPDQDEYSILESVCRHAKDTWLPT